MENHHHHQQQQQKEANHAHDADMIRSLHSPNSTSSSDSSSSGSSSNGAAAAPPPAPSTPKSITMSMDSSPYPTTFVQADTSSFKQVVQMLTGSAGTAAKRAAAGAPPPPHKNPLPPAARATGPKKPAFKLYERRNSLKNLKMIGPLLPSFLNSNAAHSPMGSPARRHQPEILSPSVLDFPSLALSPVTPLISDPFIRTQHAGNSAPSPASPEDRAIATKGFYLHPSPRSTAEPPRLLPLFPETSPRLAAASAAATT